MTVPRYEWPALMQPHAATRDATPPEAVAPTPAPVAAVSRPVNVADGYYGDWRYWVTRDPSALHPIVTVQGWDGPRYVTETREMEGASVAKVRRFIDGIIAGLAAEKAKKRAKGGR